MSAILGRVIRDARKEKGYTLDELARKAGVSVPFLSNLERGKRTSVPAVRKLFLLLDIPIDQDIVEVISSHKEEEEEDETAQLVGTLAIKLFQYTKQTIDRYLATKEQHKE